VSRDRDDRDLDLLRQRFDAVVALAAQRGYSLPGLTLQLGEASDFPNARDFAYTQRDASGTLAIVVAPKMARATAARIEGLLMHEFGHVVLMAAGEEHSERDADRAARALFGKTIRYHGMVQTTGPGVTPRPKSLPR
jgi:hypothetical protein